MGHKYTEGSFTSTDGSSRISYYTWEPEGGSPRALLQICHGMNEYIGRYGEFASYLADAGIVVCGHDHIGHGPGTPDDMLGHIPRRTGVGTLVGDLHKMTLTMKERFPGLRVFLLGHSMGSFIARLCITEHGSDYAGVILSGTGGPGQPTAAGRLLARLVGIGSGGRRRSKLIDSVAFGSYSKSFGGEKFAWISSDVAVVEKYKKDKYCTSFIFDTDAFYILFDMLGRVSSRLWATKVPKELPVLLASGCDDPVGNYGRGVREVWRRLLEAGVRDLTLKLYPGMRHEILNEVERREVYDYLLGWLNERIET